jgi:type IV pilus assembly protein PilZ
VAWGREDGDDPGMGIQFVYQNDLQRREFEGIVEKLILESLGPLLFEKLLGKAPVN